MCAEKPNAVTPFFGQGGPLHIGAWRKHGDLQCPYCRAEYELTTARLSFRQRSHAKCHVCHRTMYSWSSRNVPLFTFVNAFGKRHAISDRNRCLRSGRQAGNRVTGCPTRTSESGHHRRVKLKHERGRPSARQTPREHHGTLSGVSLSDGADNN
jgi:hypothetical protein